MADLTNEPDVERLFELTMRYFDNKLNLLVNNAGINIPVPHTNPDECYAAYKRIMQINLHSAVRLSLLTASALKKTAEQSGETTSIVNVSSIAGCRPTPVYAAYGVSKAGMSMHTNYMSIELAPLVRVNSVAPGPVETKIIERSGWSMDQFKAMTNATAPLGRVGQPEEVAHSVLFLADPVKAAYITGAQLLIDGGVNQAPLQFSWACHVSSCASPLKCAASTTMSGILKSPPASQWLSSRLISYIVCFVQRTYKIPLDLSATDNNDSFFFSSLILIVTSGGSTGGFCAHECLK